MFVEKKLDACVKLRERLRKTKREERISIAFAIAYCSVAGIVMSHFLIIGFTFWLFIAFVLVFALIMIYSAREAQVNQDQEKLGCKN